MGREKPNTIYLVRINLKLCDLFVNVLISRRAQKDYIESDWGVRAHNIWS